MQKKHLMQRTRMRNQLMKNEPKPAPKGPTRTELEMW